MIRTAPPQPSLERDELAASVRAVLTRYTPVPEGTDDPPGGYDAGLWKRLTDLGLGGLAVPEERGGFGGDYLHCHAVLVELGRALVATPYPATLIATQAALLTGGDLPERLLTATGTWAPGFTARSGRLSGEAGHVLDGGRAEVVLLSAETPDGSELFEVDPAALLREVRTTMDRSVHLATVTAHEGPAVHLGFLPQTARLADLRTIMTTADQVGGARRCLELLVGHLKQRVQFGRPIASFQAVKHRLADLLVLVEAAESASWSAARAWSDAAPDTHLLAAIAGSYCGDAYQQVAAEMVQLHGGVAITWEHPAHRFFKHAHTTTTLFGTPAAHRRALVEHLG